MTKTLTKKQHYVPRFYLKKFCERNKTINVLDKEKDNIFEANINNIACENYFYDISDDFKKNICDIEKIFSDFESNIAVNFESIIKKLNDVDKNQNTILLTEQEKKSLSDFFVIQTLRNNKQRIIISKIINNLKNISLEEISNEEIQIYAKLKPIKMIVEKLPFLSAYLSAQKWFFFFNHTNIPFYISDNPAILDRPKEFSTGRGMGFCTPNVNFYLPITPQYLLIVVENSLIPHSHHSNSNYIPCNNIDEQGVRYANDLQLLESISQIYSPTKNFFQEDKKYLRECNVLGHKKDTFIKFY